MAFNHYAKIRDILKNQEPGWYIKRIDQKTIAINFKGESREFDHYYRIFDAYNNPIKYCKFQQLDKLASILKIPVNDIIVN